MKFEMAREVFWPISKLLTLSKSKNKTLPKLKKQGLLPRIWHRYVDDIFAVVKRNQFNDILSLLNGQYEEINFVHEIQKDGNITFLELN